MVVVAVVVMVMMVARASRWDDFLAVVVFRSWLGSETHGFVSRVWNVADREPDGGVQYAGNWTPAAEYEERRALEEGAARLDGTDCRKRRSRVRLYRFLRRRIIARN